ncbi:hypothetical protein BHE74_00051438 [Ensete ventricosum]|nr:hypothetical protein GW17_00054277 [Ensete ventricosum]RWW42956.1 hypothetical protein BHE74_00051438 [Ensete ventricosum]RZS19849.1 hypothetical protein BHM03_00052292 [Ensete ventricosum]
MHESPTYERAFPCTVALPNPLISFFPASTPYKESLVPPSSPPSETSYLLLLVRRVSDGHDEPVLPYMRRLLEADERHGCRAGRLLQRRRSRRLPVDSTVLLGGQELVGGAHPAALREFEEQVHSCEAGGQEEGAAKDGRRRGRGWQPSVCRRGRGGAAAEAQRRHAEGLELRGSPQPEGQRG